MTSAGSTSNDEALRRRIDQYLEGHGLAGPDTSIVSLTGDASDRRYFRVSAAGHATVVLAVHAGPIDLASLPFANVARLLRMIPLPVPGVLGHSDPLGILTLDDLGDVTLQAHLATAPPGERSALYRQAVAFLEQLQRRGAEIDPEGFVPYGLAFDVEKLTWELDFFVTHFLVGHRGASVTASQRVALGVEFAVMAADLSAEPRVLCHRDYHSRNLMVHQGRLHIIDFQDARMGPDTYDLASLLRDSYVGLDDGEIEALIGHFLGLKGQASLQPAAFRARFDLMALQRNLKALGTFGFQASARGNPSYMQYMPRTLGYVRANLARYARFGRLHDLLAEHLAELA